MQAENNLNSIAHGISRRGLMLVLSSPSGAGKSSISRRLLESEDNLHLSVSATSRKRRPGEVEGVDYQFVNNEDFRLMINNDEFLEYAKVFDHYYGTPRAQVEGNLASGRDVLFDIDWQGTQQLKASAREDLVSVFILPPSVAELERRLMKRGQDTAEVVARRMAEASSEMSHYAEYDYIIINEDLDASVERVASILMAERLRRDRQTGLTGFVKSLREGR
ncbi:MAG TPA: guanylate kinase [Alphaproteobacteria bacterium]|jgi:guanylate kinase|nr:guanylate kinase [Alphaproteobacteria bacterium]HCV63160.1 guanylate kinase [Alphaproteobacteria bacterium]|tara:strand:- start:590 stop:1252 length:663 start_codon:yes stop_codon:yes gene_type:complete